MNDQIFTVQNTEWNSDLYEYLVAPKLNSDLYVESWMDGPAADKVIERFHELN